MFIVFNKDKISLYMILLSTVIILFGLAFNVKQANTIETSTNIEKSSNSILNDIEVNANIESLNQLYE